MIIKLRRLIRWILITLRYFSLTKIYGMDIAKSARIAFYTKLDKTYPRGVHIGEESYVADGVIIYSHDFSRALHSDTHIGRRCFIGANAIVMCGITIGDEVIVGSGAIVTKDVPSNCIVAGNPARVIRTGIHTKKFGQLIQ